MKTNRLALSHLAIGALLMSSCANEDIPNASSASDKTVAFNSYMGRGLSRASSTTSDNLANFGVTAFLNDGTGYCDGLVPDFMHNQLVEKSGSKWVYSPLKYWPSDPDKKVSFFAYSPYVAAGSPALDNASAITGISDNAYEGDPTLTFEVGTDVSKHIDLVYAQWIDGTNADNAISLDFKHALCRVGFRVIGWQPGGSETYDANTTITINSVKLATYRKAATLNLANGQWSNRVNTEELRAFTLSTRNGLLQNNVITAGDTQPKQLNKDDDYLMILPPSGGGEEYVVFLDYTVETLDDSLEDGKFSFRNNVYRRVVAYFEAGKSYNILVQLGHPFLYPDSSDTPVIDPDPDPENPIDPTPATKNSYVSFSATVADWDNASEEIELPLSDAQTTSL